MDEINGKANEVSLMQKYAQELIGCETNAVRLKQITANMLESFTITVTKNKANFTVAVNQWTT